MKRFLAVLLISILYIFTVGPVMAGGTGTGFDFAVFRLVMGFTACLFVFDMLYNGKVSAREKTIYLLTCSIVIVSGLVIAIPTAYGLLFQISFVDAVSALILNTVGGKMTFVLAWTTIPVASVIMTILVANKNNKKCEKLLDTISEL